GLALTGSELGVGVARTARLHGVDEVPERVAAAQPPLPYRRPVGTERTGPDDMRTGAVIHVRSILQAIDGARAAAAAAPHVAVMRSLAVHLCGHRAGDHSRLGAGPEKLPVVGEAHALVRVVPLIGFDQVATEVLE